MIFKSLRPKRCQGTPPAARHRALLTYLSTSSQDEQAVLACACCTMAAPASDFDALPTIMQQIADVAAAAGHHTPSRAAHSAAHSTATSIHTARTAPSGVATVAAAYQHAPTPTAHGSVSRGILRDAVRSSTRTVGSLRPQHAAATEPAGPGRAQPAWPTAHGGGQAPPVRRALQYSHPATPTPAHQEPRPPVVYPSPSYALPPNPTHAVSSQHPPATPGPRGQTAAVMDEPGSVRAQVSTARSLHTMQVMRNHLRAGSVTGDASMRQLLDTFANMDIDGDGVLSRADFKRGTCCIYGRSHKLPA